MNFDFRNIGWIISYSILILLVISFIAGQFGISAIPHMGYLVLILAVCVGIAMVISIGKDFKIEKAEIIMFILAMGVLVGGFYMLKTYVPSLFSALPDNLESSLNNLFSAVGG